MKSNSFRLRKLNLPRVHSTIEHSLSMVRSPFATEPFVLRFATTRRATCRDRERSHSAGLTAINFKLTPLDHARIAVSLAILPLTSRLEI